MYHRLIPVVNRAANLVEAASLVYSAYKLLKERPTDDRYKLSKYTGGKKNE